MEELRNSFTTAIIIEHGDFDSREMVTLSVDDHFLSAYLFYGAILMLKTWVMSFLLVNTTFFHSYNYHTTDISVSIKMII